MYKQAAIRRLIPPGQRRKGKMHGGIIQIWVTRACDKACFGCTQGSNLRGPAGLMSIDQFEEACRSLQDYFGVVGVFGGNPCLHPQFPKLCEIIARYIPFNRRGLWSNKLFGHGALCRRTFSPNFSNLNVHLDHEAAKEISKDWPEAKVWGAHTDSRHSPPYVAIQDLLEDEERQWELISECDINRYWSAMVGVFRGELRAWFCEIAGAQAMLHQREPDYPDTGIPVEKGWWQRPMADYAAQALYHCPACGVPLRGYGALAQGSATQSEQVTKTHQNIFLPRVRERSVQVVTSISALHSKNLKVTDYLGGAKQ